MTSFHWHPYWSCLIRSLENVRLNKIFERTYQDGTGVGLVVDKERGYLSHACVLTIRKKEKGVPLPMVQVGGLWGKGCNGGPVGGISWMWCWLVGWLACTVVLVRPVVDDPRYVGVGIFLGFCSEGGSCTWMNMASLMVLGWLFTSLCIMLNWLGSMWCPVVELCWCMGEGALKCSLILSPSVPPDSPM